MYICTLVTFLLYVKVWIMSNHFFLICILVSLINIYIYVKKSVYSTQILHTDFLLHNHNIRTFIPFNKITLFILKREQNWQ